MRKPKGEVEHFTDEEVSILISNLKGDRYRELILLALGTGLRRGELLALTWSDIDFKNNIIKVNKSLAKAYIISADGSKERKHIIQVPKTKRSIREVPLKTVSELLGHSSTEMTYNTYTHVIPKQKETAVEKLNYMFEC